MASGFGKFFPSRELSRKERKDDNPMKQGQGHAEGAAKHPRKTRIVFRWCANCMWLGIIVMEDHAPPVG